MKISRVAVERNETHANIPIIARAIAIVAPVKRKLRELFNRHARAGLAAFTLSVKQRLFAVFFHEYRMQIAFGLTSQPNTSELLCKSLHVLGKGSSGDNDIPCIGSHNLAGRKDYSSRWKVRRFHPRDTPARRINAGRAVRFPNSASISSRGNIQRNRIRKLIIALP